MIDLTQFTPWTLFTDLGFISILLLVGKTDTTIIHTPQLDRGLARTGVRT
jgi:hypothetical protein